MQINIFMRDRRQSSLSRLKQEELAAWYFKAKFASLSTFVLFLYLRLLWTLLCIHNVPGHTQSFSKETQEACVWTVCLSLTSGKVCPNIHEFPRVSENVI